MAKKKKVQVIEEPKVEVTFTKDNDGFVTISQPLTPNLEDLLKEKLGAK